MVGWQEVREVRKPPHPKQYIYESRNIVGVVKYNKQSLVSADRLGSRLLVERVIPTICLQALLCTCCNVCTAFHATIPGSYTEVYSKISSAVTLRVKNHIG